MTDHHLTDEGLNAYVDGELPPRERPCVAASIARNPDLARRVAVLTRLKTAVADSAGPAPERFPPRVKRHWSRRAPVRYGAAAAVLLLAVTTVWMFGVVPDRRADAWLSRGIASHVAWTAEALRPSKVALDAEALLTTVQALDHPLHVPDMRAAKLRLTGARYIAPDGENENPAVQLRYTGRRGCRVSLWIAPAPDTLPTSLEEHRLGAQRGFSWRVDDIGYAIFATGMAARRFELLVRNTYRATQAHRRPPTNWREELRTASNAAPPCSA